MGLAPRLDIKQSQQLVMTPQLQQAIKLLQLSNLDLANYVEQELEKNPLLEPADADLQTDTPAEIVRTDTEGFGEETPNSEGLADLSLTEGAAVEYEKDSPLDTDYDNLYNNDADSDAPQPQNSPEQDYISGSMSGTASGFSDYSFEDSLTEEKTLQDHLTDQLQLMNLPVTTKFIAAYLIDLISDTGYFTHPIEEVANSLGCERELVETTLEILRDFEPAGVFARDLADCLALQLKEKNRLDPAMQAFLENLDLLAKRDLKSLMQICAVDQEDLTEMISEIKELDPKPGLQFQSAEAATLIPDVFISQNPDGTWNIELNSETLPKVLVNNRYYAQISGKGLKKNEKEFISECLNSANWLVKSLDQRANTILKVATELVRQQEMFFRYGIAHLRPLNLKAIADAIEMHESTVSRVTANKYMATPSGVFELKYFFTSAINSTGGGDAHAAESVKFKLKQLIDEEKPNAILSDDKIVELMKKEGIDIARRTVAKYRDALKIPSSVERRRQKKLLTT
ncbi:RNA polymerase factor sigma-54 [Sneathiella glossodoripedis]|uniref:RNA polymerase factor sigma-54 n=1 Tax=Sneathiella glossodoripedis TaxID=418853 RepID=UPI00046EC460|nr:RNA polymerase factor sigma-54 [Sneathiella glossodoripedis]